MTRGDRLEAAVRELLAALRAELVDASLPELQLPEEPAVDLELTPRHPEEGDTRREPGISETPASPPGLAGEGADQEQPGEPSPHTAVPEGGLFEEPDAEAVRPAAAEPGPGTTIACRDYRGHASAHRMVDGAWRCDLCEAQTSWLAPVAGGAPAA